MLTEAAIKYLNGGSAIDVFICLNEIINRHFTNNHVSPTRYLNMSEQVASMINLPFEKIESGEF